MSEQQEIAAGRQANQQVLQQYRIYPDQQLQHYVNSVGQRLAAKSHRANLNYQFTVVDSTEINAFALPGGYIYITRGLMAYLNSEAELAAVLGHEIGHVTARHGVRQQSSAQAAAVGAGVLSILLPELTNAGLGQTVNMLGTALLRGYGREHELEADRLGADYLAATGYDPEAMMSVIRTLKEHELFDRELARREGRQARAYHGVFSTHPDNDTRLREIIDYARDGIETSGQWHRDRYLDEIDGMLFGPNPAEGVLVGNQFYHPDLGIALRFPDRWRVANRPDQVIAIDPNAGAQIQLRIAQVPNGASAEAVMQQIGVTQLAQTEKIRAPGLDGLTGITQVSANGATMNARLAAIVVENSGYLITALARDPAKFSAYDAAFRSVAHSFHRLTDEERARATGQRLRVVGLRGRVSWDALAASSPLQKLPEAHLRLLNAVGGDTASPASPRIKVVE